jgi:uncharacterized membrane protein YfcA
LLPELLSLLLYDSALWRSEVRNLAILDKASAQTHRQGASGWWVFCFPGDLVLETEGVMLFVIGFVIAVTVGLTGIGGGSFTVPALILLAGLAPKTAVGTAFVFAGVLRLIVGPFYLWGKQVRGAYVWRLLKGAIPGLLIGTYALRLFASNQASPGLLILLGVLLTASSSLTFARPLQNHEFARKNAGWLSWFALPIGIESGFSSAGAGALGTVLLLNYSEMSPSEVVGTDLLFGLGLAAIGSAIHLQIGSVSSSTLLQLLAAGIPGVLLGFLLGRRTPARKLKPAIALIAILAGLQLVWTGSRTLLTTLAQAAHPPAASAENQSRIVEPANRPNPPETQTTGIALQLADR